VYGRAKHFRQLLDLCGVNDVWQTDVHTAEQAVHEPSVAEVQVNNENIRRRKSLSFSKIVLEMIKAANRTVRSETSN
jgi:hypothetical protein